MLLTDEIADLLGAQSHVLQPLRTVAALGVEDCWIGAGLLRNAVWDYLHGFSASPVPGSDIDVVYYDAADVRPTADLSIQQRLCAAAPGLPWSVHNQARMHGPNGDPPYRDVTDAIAHWPETATAIAARIEDGRITILAPHGLQDLIGLIVRPTPAFAAKLEVYSARQAAKKWHERWPKLQFIGAP